MIQIKSRNYKTTFSTFYVYVAKSRHLENPSDAKRNEQRTTIAVGLHLFEKLEYGNSKIEQHDMGHIVGSTQLKESNQIP